MVWTYTPSRFMLPTSHFDEARAGKAVNFIQLLPHTKGAWEKKKFILMDWQRQIIMDLFGIIREDGTRQFRTAYIEIPKKNCITVLVHRNVFVKILIELRENRKAGRATA